MIPGLKLTDLLNTYPDEGVISFRGNRMLIYQSDAIRELRKEMIHTLGEDIARGMLTRFGYQCGLNDVTTFRNYFNFEKDSDWMLAGPLMHALEGIVHSSDMLLDYDRQKGTFLMQGTWRNSYEADHHLRLYGLSREPVCWTLSGYASGFATGFMGHKVICVETMCQGMGDPHCRYEMRAIESWNGEASRNIEDLKQCLVVKSLQRMVSEERERAALWCKMGNAVLDISTNLDSTNLPEKLVRYARELMNAERAVLAIVTEKTKRVILYEALEQNIVNMEVFNFGNNPVNTILKTGKPVITNNRNIVGVPLFSKKQLIGAMVVINKKNGEQYSPQAQDFLMVLGAQAAVALDNARLYERTNEKLQEKVTELFNLNEMLSNEKAALQKSATIHNQLTSLVLEGKGLDEISRNLAQIIDKEILVADHFFQVLSCSPAGKADRESITDIWNKAINNQDIKEQLSLDSNKHLFRFAFPVKEGGSQGNVVVLPVIAGKDYLGYVVTIEEDELLRELDCIALEHAATVIALEMLKQKAAFETERRLRKDFFEELLTGNYDNEEVIKRRAAQLGLDLNKPYRLMSIDISYDKLQNGQIHTVENFLEVVDRSVKKLCICIFLSTGKKDIVGLLPVIDNSCYEENNLFKMAHELESQLSVNLTEHEWWVGIGSVCNQLSEFAGSYKEACATIDIAKTLNCKNRCLAYENLGILGLVNINVDRFHKFIRRVIGPLIDYDEKNKSQLLETLKLYFKNNCNLLRAARNGFINSATMKYRLRRVAEIADINLNDAETVLLVHMALKLIEGI